MSSRWFCATPSFSKASSRICSGVIINFSLKRVEIDGFTQRPVDLSLLHHFQFSSIQSRKQLCAGAWNFVARRVAFLTGQKEPAHRAVLVRVLLGGAAVLHCLDQVAVDSLLVLRLGVIGTVVWVDA